MTDIICSECGITFSMPERYVQARREDHKTFYCPNGHARYFPQWSEAERLRAQLKGSRDSVDYWRAKARDAENARRAEKAAKTRLRNQYAAKADDDA